MVPQRPGVVRPESMTGGGVKNAAESWQTKLASALKLVVDQEQEKYNMEDSMIANSHPAGQRDPVFPAVIAGGGTPAVSKRTKKHFTPQEVSDLRRGVEKHGVGNWAKMLSDQDLKFHSSRNTVSLKDKWRNLMKTISKK